NLPDFTRLADGPFKVSAGGKRSCLIDNGQVLCWGCLKPYFYDTAVPEALPALCVAIHVAHGPEVTFVRTPGGCVWCYPSSRGFALAATEALTLANGD